MTIQIGTDACESGTVAGLVHSKFEELYGEETAGSDTVRGVAYSIAYGIVEGLRTQIADGEAVGRAGANLTGLEIDGGGGGAPTDATYVVATSNGALSAERVATSTTTVLVDTSVAGQMQWSVPDASTSDKGVVRFANSGSATAGRAVEATDSRLSNDRDPTAHAVSHQNNGDDEINVAGLSGELADPQPPKAHASSHMSAGSDPIRLDELKAPTDVTTLNATTSAHGLLQKLDGSSGRFLSGNSSSGTNGWIAMAGPDPYVEAPILFNQAVTSGVAFTVFETADIPEGFAGVVVWEYYAWGGTAGSSAVGHTTGARANLRRLTAGSLLVADGGQTAALGEGTSWTTNNAANGNKFRVQLTTSVTSTFYVSGFYRIYGAVLA